MSYEYRKKPVIIEAIQFQGPDSLSIMRDAWGDPFAAHVNMTPETARKMRISTLEGIMQACVGDWIIRGVEGEFYPCKNSIFEKTYETV